MRFETEEQAVQYIFSSLASTDWRRRGLDEHSRDLTPTRMLLKSAGLPATSREYAVVTGSKGKGSTTMMTANILQHLGHTVGTITSPHLLNHRERIRINGRMIDSTAFLRILDDLAPAIDRVLVNLTAGKYLSPQGIFLAIALRWFDEQNAGAAVIEVGRGGRFDDNALVPNMLSLFTPVFLEHTNYLGETLERIGWHKAGIIKPMSFAFSVPQDKAVLDAIRIEADHHNAQFDWIAPIDMGEYIATDPDGVRFRLTRYGEVKLSMLGKYEIQNATLAVQGAGNIHARLLSSKTEGIQHASAEYVQQVKAGLRATRWPGRLQKLQSTPNVFVDGAIHPLSAKNCLDSLADISTGTLVVVLAIPADRDYEAVYEVFGKPAAALILTETQRDRTTTFPERERALSVAAQVCDDVQHAPTLEAAVEAAIQKAGAAGTVLLALAQPVIADAMALWKIDLDLV